MMLRNLIDEVRSRRVLAFAALGVLLALALPLLFLKSAPDGAPTANTAAPAAAEEAKLPDRAARLLATSDADAVAGRASGSSHDPFSPPAAYRSTIAAAEAKGGAGGAGGAAAAAAPGNAPAGSAAAKEAANAQAGGGSKGLEPVPVVIKNPGATTPSTSNATSPSKSTSSRKPARSLNSANAAVDIRYGAKRDTRIRRAIRRQKAFYIHGKLVAVFVKYSPVRKAAVFAVAPGLHISGDTKCRVSNGACRYVDLPAGSHAWLTMVTPNRTIVSRRLDVVHIKRRSPGTTRALSASARSEAGCLARKLVAMERGDALLGRNACKN
jgi:hypothetical protein